MKPTRPRRGLFGLPRRTRILLAILTGGYLLLGGRPGADDAVASPPSESSSVLAETPPEVGDPATIQEAGGEAVATPQEERASTGLEASEDEQDRAAHFFLILIAILAFAKAFGELAERFGQPAVLGELVAGLILGTSVLGWVPLEGPTAEIIHLLAEVGVAILLFEIGLETDLKE
ncbi:MAG TPA: cation:proton antiporter, partial [Longimicrobiales bacterium]|nr:cation:proton antiporter [Longimicrobiales bacterium]